MAPDLDKILFRPNDKGRTEKIMNLRKKLRSATWFEPGDEDYKSLVDIISKVKSEKDKALIDFTEKFDNVKLNQTDLTVSDKEIQSAYNQTPEHLLYSIKKSIDNVRKYQQEILAFKNIPSKVKYTPIQRVGVCVPGASAPLPSTVIMTAVPAQTAGVKEISLISPPRYKNSIHPVILALCFELGIKKVYRIGGAHAVAALAYGTETVKPVNMIVGPGNKWVQMAKKQVFGKVKIDSIAGPSEVLIIANDSANPKFLAADMLSQAEHAPGSAVLLTDSIPLAEKTITQLEKQLDSLNRSEKTLKFLKDYSAVIAFDTIEQAIDQANQIATEHLQIQCGKDNKNIAEKIKNAGAIFIGDYSPVACGDYYAGPSHTLPTGGTAEFFSPLSSNDFVKSTSIIQYDKNKLLKSSEDIIKLAETEGLDAHAESVKIRKQNS
jgi:histidinol dehydrogenase